MQLEYGGQPEATRAHESRRISWGLLAGIAAVVVLLVAVAAVLLASRDASVVATDVRPAAISGDPAGLDQSVVISGYVQEMLTERAMMISSDLNAEPVLVLLTPNVLMNGSPPIAGAAPISLLLPDDPVQLFGTVGSFDRQAVAEEHGLVLHEALFDAWEGQPVIVADQIDTAPIASLDSPAEP